MFGIGRIFSGFFNKKPSLDSLSNVNVVADLSINPHGVSSSAPYLQSCLAILKNHNLNPVVHACGTNIEGGWSQIQSALKECHQALHAQNINNVSSTIHISTRIDKPDSIGRRLARV
jgi:uncharacterized protein (TIGR00106 family)